MGIVRPLIVIVLILSLLANWVLYNHVYSRRAVIVVNGQPITLSDEYNYLQDRWGKQALAQLVTADLITQAAQKAHVMPTKDEVTKDFKRMLDESPTLSAEMANYPWKARAERDSILENLALRNLQINGVQVTNDELLNFFNENPGKFDVPDKAKVTWLVATDATALNTADKMIQNGVSDPTVIRDQLRGKIGLLGNFGRVTLLRPFGTNQNAIVFNMKPGQSKVLPASPLTGNLRSIIRLDQIIPGHKVTFQEVQNKVAIAVKMTRGRNGSEVFHDLYDSATINSDIPGLKQDVERVLFPNRSKPAS